MKRLISTAGLICLIVLFAGISKAQETTPLDTAASKNTPIPVSDIIVQATEVNSFLREKRTRLMTDNRKREISTRIDTLTSRLALLREDPRIHRTEDLNLRSLENLESEWNFLDAQFEEEQQMLNEILQRKIEQKEEMVKLREVWELTYQETDRTAIAAPLQAQIRTTLNDIQDTENLFEEESKFVQERLVKVSSGIIFTNQVQENILSAKNQLTRSMLALDSPPIWKEFHHKQDSIIVFEDQRSIIDDAILGLRDFYNQYSQRIWLHLVLSILIIIFIYIIYGNLRHSLPEEDTPDINAVKSITSKPLASGWMISSILSFIMYNKLNDVVALIVSMLLLPPVIIILRTVIRGPARKYIYLPLIAIVMVELHRIVYSEDLLSRFWLFGLILFGFFSLYLVFGTKGHRQNILGGRLGKILVFASFIFFGMLVVAFFANFIGAISLSEFLTHAVIESATVSLFLYAFMATLNSIITTTIYSHYLTKSYILNQYKGLIHKRLKSLVNIIAVYMLANLIFRIFGIWDPVSGSIKTVLTYPIQVGSMAFSLWNLFMFFFIIWLTISISKLIRNIFESEARIRDRMRRGAPGAMSLLLRIAIITVGFLLAIAAAGVKMDRLAILLGAFGVGIGFGLQNIFNNLVSGIIIAFERPIKEGDIIEVGSLLGTVKEIGIRSSIIHTYDGSEVITPNGNLISNDLINWTRTDMRRRAEVQVGVAYGTDPQMMIDLLRDAAGKYEKAMKQPEPLGLFTGFGDSSLDFRLLFWIEDADLRWQVQSEMTVRVHDAIVKAGITIPFPQRDLHVQTVDQQILDRVRAQDGIAGQQKGSSGEGKSGRGKPVD